MDRVGGLEPGTEKVCSKCRIQAVGSERLSTRGSTAERCGPVAGEKGQTTNDTIRVRCAHKQQQPSVPRLVMRCVRAGGAGESEMAYRKNDGGNFTALLATARAKRTRVMVDGRWKTGRSDWRRR